MFLLFGIFSALIIFQCFLIESSSELYDTSPSEVLKLYQEFLEKLNSTYNQTATKIKDDQFNVKDAVEQALLRAEYYLFTELTLNNWYDFNDLIKKAKAQGTDYERCNSFKTEFSDSVDIFLPNLTLCINATDDEAQSYLQTQLVEVNTLNTNLPNITAEVESCGSSNQTCLTEVANKITKLNDTVPQEMLDIAEKTGTAAENYLVEVQSCTDHARLRLKVRVRTIMMEYAECTGLENI